MNETSAGPGIPPGPTTQTGHHRPRPPHQDLDRLRRSVDDRYIAGVAGGLGRHFGIDPTVIRVLLAVLTFFGGAGILIYGVCWLFVPEEGSEHAAIRVSSEPRKLLILAAAGIGVLLVLGHAFNFHTGWLAVTLAVAIAVVMIYRDRKDNRRASRAAQAQAWADHRAAAAAGMVPAYEGAPFTPSATSPSEPTWPTETTAASTRTTDTTEATTVIPDYAAVPPTPPTPPAPPAWQPPQPPLVPPRPKRTGVIWFWPTLAMIAIALGVIGVYDADHHVDGGVYPAVALAISGVMLVVGSFVGRPGGLVLVGLTSSAALALSGVTGGYHFSGNDLKVTPKSAAAVQSSYSGTNGRILLDLTEVSDPQNLAGRTIHLRLNAGEIRVILPRTVNASVDADFGFAGGIDIPGYSGGGIQDSIERQLVGSQAGTAQNLRLDLHAKVGHIEVEVEKP